jgi:hypothetical protein
MCILIYILSQIPGIVVGIFIALFTNYLWKLFEDKQNNKIIFRELKEHVIDEIEYNCKPSVGNSQCPFKLEFHKKISNNHNLSTELKNEIKELIYNAELCNAHGSLRNLKVSPGGVKAASKKLKADILQINVK